MESYAARLARVQQRCDDLDAIRQTRLLTEEEVKEYFEGWASLHQEPGPSDAEHGLDPEQRRREPVSTELIPAWTGARFCRRTGKIELVPPPECKGKGKGKSKAFIEWRQHGFPTRWRLSQKDFVAELHLPYAYKVNFLEPPIYEWQRTTQPPCHVIAALRREEDEQARAAWGTDHRRRRPQSPRRPPSRRPEPSPKRATRTSVDQSVLDQFREISRNQAAGINTNDPASDPHYWEEYTSQAAGPKAAGPKEPPQPPPAHLLGVPTPGVPALTYPKSPFQGTVQRPPSPPFATEENPGSDSKAYHSPSEQIQCVAVCTIVKLHWQQLLA